MLWLGCGQQQKRHMAASPPAGVRRRMERNRQKLVGQDKGSLTEQQTKGTGTTMIQIRRKHNTNHTTQRTAFPDQTAAALSRAASEFPPPSSPPPEPSMTAHGMEYPQVGSARPAVPLSWIPLKISPVLAAARTGDIWKDRSEQSFPF